MIFFLLTASWRWSEFSSPLLFTGMLIFACVLKIIFHHIHFLEKVLPESCVLIVVGSICGLFIDKVLLHHTTEKRFEEFPKFTASLFFNILLPPIIFDSAMSLYNKEFLSTFVSVVVFAVFGTLFNVFTVGLSLYGVSARSENKLKLRLNELCPFGFQPFLLVICIKLPAGPINPKQNWIVLPNDLI